uniref:Recombinase domain-containing protein n=1 Tax=Ascaris lumbricoides TaxID=6252 RepID=A0A0M3ICJ3_ASCLU
MEDIRFGGIVTTESRDNIIAHCRKGGRRYESEFTQTRQFTNEYASKTPKWFIGEMHSMNVHSIVGLSGHSSSADWYQSMSSPID